MSQDLQHPFDSSWMASDFSQQWEEILPVIVNNYRSLILFTLKRMGITRFDSLEFREEDETILVFVIVDGQCKEVDFDRYIRHDDHRETEWRMEIDCLRADAAMEGKPLAADCIIDQLKSLHWRNSSASDK